MKYILTTTTLERDWARKEQVYTFNNKDEVIQHLLKCKFHYTLTVD